MTKKQLQISIRVLIIINLILVGYLIFSKIVSKGSNKEPVASIGKDKVTRQEWLDLLEDQYGEEVLRQLVDEKIIIQLADKYDVQIDDNYLEREFTMLKAMYQPSNSNDVDEEEWKEQLKLTMLLEELLTLDVTISDAEMKQYYEQNKSQYKLKPSYNIAHIVVEQEAEGHQVVKELEKGASFSVLAKEVSIDEFTANDGGKLGYLSEEDEQYSYYLEELVDADVGTIIGPLNVGDQFAVAMLIDIIPGENYPFEKVKDHLRRKIALEQMDVPPSTKPFWDELKVDWYYSN